jgi:hypothetical protein
MWYNTRGTRYDVERISKKKWIEVMSLQKGKVNNRLKRVKIELFPLKSSKAAKRLSLLWKKKNETLMSLEWKRIFFVVVVKKKARYNE